MGVGVEVSIGMKVDVEVGQNNVDLKVEGQKSTVVAACS